MGIVKFYIPRWLPIHNRLTNLPVLWLLTTIIPCWSYQRLLPLNPAQQVEWAILDTFDALAPTYDNPQTIEAVKSWLEASSLEDIDVHLGGNGILASGRKP